MLNPRKRFEDAEKIADQLEKEGRYFTDRAQVLAFTIFAVCFTLTILILQGVKSFGVFGLELKFIALIGLVVSFIASVMSLRYPIDYRLVRYFPVNESNEKYHPTKEFTFLESVNFHKNGERYLLKKNYTAGFKRELLSQKKVMIEVFLANSNTKKAKYEFIYHFDWDKLFAYYTEHGQHGLKVLHEKVEMALLCALEELVWKVKGNSDRELVDIVLHEFNPFEVIPGEIIKRRFVGLEIVHQEGQPFDSTVKV